MKPQVSLQPLKDYHPERVRAALLKLLDPLGGIGTFVKPGQKVLIKPNMLSGKDPARAVTTHPELVRQTILLVQGAGGEVSVGDSPGIGKPQDVARKCGIWQVIEETGAQFAPFAESVPVHLKDGTFHQLEIARDALEADLVINLPKLKTHQMMGFTGAVKNLFGLVVGTRKVRLHLQAGTDKAFFALMLLELSERFAPALSIMDAVIAMEGDGPGSGDPVAVGALLASSNPLALDTLATTLVGLPTESVWTQRVALETGRFGADLVQLELFGSDWRTLQPKQFRPAKNTDINFGLPVPLKNLLRNGLSAKPFINQRCERCGACVRHCPPEAMKLDSCGVKVDYSRCIRCFCCQELCPFNAIETRQGALLRLAEMLKGK